MDSTPIGLRIRRLRTLRDMTQEQLAHLSGKSERWLRYIESGKGAPDTNTVKELASVLRFDIPVIMGLEPIPGTLARDQRDSMAQSGISPIINSHKESIDRSHNVSDPDMTNMEAFRVADRQLGGGHLYSAVISYLKVELGPRLLTGTADQFEAAASLTGMAGWMAHDAGNHKLAEVHFDQASRLAQAGEAADIAADVAAARAHLAIHLGRPNHALQIAQQGHSCISRRSSYPGLKSRLYAMEANAAAILGNKVDAVRLLHRAEAALDGSTSTASLWVSPYDEASLAGETARCLHSIGDFTAAQQAAELVIALRPKERARSRAFAQISLALITMTRPRADVVEACSIGMEVIKATSALASARIVHQLNDLRRLMLPYRTVQEVGDFLQHLETTIPQRKTAYQLSTRGEPPT